MKSIVDAGQNTGARGPRAHILREEIRHLWSRLQGDLPRDPSEGLRIAFCASHPGEGTSTMAGNFAIFQGEQGRRTTLVETNLRSPSLAPHFAVGSTPGLAEYLDQTAQLNESTRTNVAPFVDLIPAGSAPVDLYNPFGDGALLQLLDDLKHQAEIVVLDVPALSASPEAGPILRAADLTVLVAQANVVRKQSIQKSIKTIRDLGVPLGGIVLNHLTYDLPPFLERLL